MDHPSFTIKEALRFGWEGFKANWLFLVICELMVFALPGLIGSILEQATDLAIGVALVVYIVSYILQAGWLKGLLLIVEGAKPSLHLLYSNYALCLKLMLTMFLYCLIIGVGFLLLIIPGIYWLFQLSMSGWLVVDGLGPIAALKMSRKITKNQLCKIALLCFALLGINFLGLLALGVGCLVTFPVTAIAMAYVYRKLKQQHALALYAPLIE